MVKAHGKYVLLKPINRKQSVKEQLKAGKLILTESKYQAQPYLGIVKAVGSEVPKDREYRVNDTVIFDEPSPQGFTHEGKDYIPVKHDQIIGKITDDNKENSI